MFKYVALGPLIWHGQSCCISLFIEISLIILLHIDSETGLLQGKENDKNYHICALHDPLFDEEAVAQKEQSYENSDILPSERENSMDRDFINDDITDEAGTESENSQENQSANNTESESENSQESQSAQKMLGEIINDLQRNTSQVST